MKARYFSWDSVSSRETHKGTWGGGRGGGRRRILGDHLIFRRTEGGTEGITRNREPKRGGTLKTFWKDLGEDHSNLLGQCQTWGKGGRGGRGGHESYQ